MAKEKMITRTFTITICKVMFVDITNSTINMVNQAIVGEHTPDTALKWVKEHNDTDVLKAVTVTDLSLVEQLYGMTETEFLATAKLLPPRKASGSTENTEDENKE